MKIPPRGWLLIAAAGAYFAFLWPAALRAVPENDLWWMFPTMEHYLQGRSPWQVFLFLFDALPVGFAQPTLKIFMYGVARLCGPEVRWLMLASMVIQTCNAALLGLLARQWGLSLRTSAVASVLFLTFFGHFHAVLWPTASQHLLAMTNILALLNLYFWTEQQLREGKGAAAGFLGVALATLAASMQRSVLIAMVVIAVDIIAFSRDAKERSARFLRWAWVFALFALYPVVMLTVAGEPIITEGIRKMSIPDGLRTLIVTDPLFPNPIPWGFRSAVLFSFVLAGLGTAAAALRSAPGRWLDRDGWRLWAAAGAVVLLLWCLKDHRQLLFPYNGFVPFLASFSILLDPLRAAFGMDAVEPYYLLAPQVSAGTILLALAALAAFWKNDVSRNGKLALLLAWYLITLGVTLHQNSSLPLRTPSRYFIYLSPVVAIIVACGLSSLMEGIFRGKRAGRLPEIALYCVVAALCLSNLAAVRVALFRGRLANGLLFYDDYRTVRIIRDEASESGEVRVAGVVPMPIREVWRDFPLAVPPDYDNLAVASIALEAGSIRSARGAAADAGSKAPLYRLEGVRVLNPLDHPVEPFHQLVGGGRGQLSHKHMAEGTAVLEEAAARPPFLIAHLTRGVRVSDLRWITGGPGVTDWLDRVVAAQRERGQPEPAKLTRVRELVQDEARSYMQAMVFLAFAEEKQDRKLESQYWLSQTQLVETDPEAVVHGMNMFPTGSLREDVATFSKKAGDPLFLLEPVNPKKEDYAVGRFLLRLILGLDIRSSWDRRFSKVL